MPEANQFDLDVFVSYSRKDKEWVRGVLLPRVEDAGLKAFIDFRDFRAGAPSIKECERGVVRCRKTLLILTPSYVESGWTEIENVMAQTLDPANANLRIIPLLRVNCQMPLRIGALTYIDLTDGADQELAWRQLLTALGKPPEPQPPREPQRAEWFLAHPYPMPPNFTGRQAERTMLNRWLSEDAAHPLLSLRALGGFGKSALVWHWLTHDVQPHIWPRAVWWSFYEGDATFEHFLFQALDYVSGDSVDVTKLSVKDSALRLLQVLRSPGTLLVLDGFERVLRAFGGMDAAYQGDVAKHEESDGDCISPVAELFLHHVALQPHVRSKVLLTTRLCPRVLEAKGGGLVAGAREEPVGQMQPADAVAFFHAQGIRGTRAEIEAACAPYGYHPLCLRLLAGLVLRDLQQPGDIATAQRLDVSGDLIQRQHHVLEMSYDCLAPSRQEVLGLIACFRSPVAYRSLTALADTTRDERAQLRKRGESKKESSSSRPCLAVGELDDDLLDLVARGLLQHDSREGRFDLHPIVRRYAYDRLAAADRAATHTRLRDYFAAVPAPEEVTKLEDLAPAIELYHHTVRAGQLDEAFALFRSRLNARLFYQLGAYQLTIDLLQALFPDGVDRPPRLTNALDQASTLNSLANCYSLSGQPRRAVPLFERHIAIHEVNRSWRDLAIGLANVSDDQVKIAILKIAEVNLRRSISLSREGEHKYDEAIGRQELGRALAYRGAYDESEVELTRALAMFEEIGTKQSQGVVWAYRALHELLRLRHSSQQDWRGAWARKSGRVLKPARRALELADEDARTHYANVRDYVRAHWLLGAAHRVAGRPGEADHHLQEALERCRRINMVDLEADILTDLARLRAATGAADEAQRLAEEALLVTQRSHYALQGADARIELARLALSRGDRAAAIEHAEEARLLATCDGPPDFTYAAAYAESSALVEQL